MAATARRVALMVGAASAALAVLWFTDDQQLRIFVSGLGSGALVGAIALGVVLTYRGSGVVNFANGAIAMYAAYVFNGLRRTGRLFVPPLPNPLALVEGVVHCLGGPADFQLPHWPTQLSFGGPIEPAPALALSLGVCVLLGLVFHFCIFRPLRAAPPLAKVVASVGLLLVSQSTVILRFTSQAQPVKPIIAKSKPFVLPGDIRIAKDQLVVAIVVVAIAIALWAMFRFTRFGLATRAAAENEKGAVLLGFSPDALAGANWVLSTVMAGLLGILVASISASTDPVTVPLLIVSALGAALVGGFTSFSLTVVAAFAIEGTKSLISYWGTLSWFPRSGGNALPGVKEVLPFVVVVVALWVRGRSLPTRGVISSGRLPFAPRPAHVGPLAALPAAAAIVGLLTLGPDWRLAIINSLVGIVICLSLVVLTGFVGQISLAQMALAGAAGFTLSKLTTDHAIPFPIGPLIGAVFAALIGLVIAIPAVRVRGVNLAVVTVAASLAIENFVFKNSAWSGGLEGARVTPPRLFGLRFGPNDAAAITNGKLPNPWFGVFCVVVVLLLSLLVVNLRRSTTGRQMLAVRSNERAAAAAGINVAGVKMLAFAVSAFIAGLGGALSGYRFGSVTPDNFGVVASLTFLAFAYLGGISSVAGAVIGGCIVGGGLTFTMLREWFGVAPQFTNLLGGLGLIITAIANPEGIAGAWRGAAHKIGVRLRADRMPAPARPAAALQSVPVGEAVS